jgi:hypothetical protein
MSQDKSDGYVSQGRLDVKEAEVILPRLKSAKIKFEISTDLSGRRNFQAPIKDSRIELFVHQDDLDAWQAIRSEYYIVE